MSSLIISNKKNHPVQIVLVCLLWAGIVLGIISSRSGLTPETATNFSHQYFLSIATRLLPTTPITILKKTALLEDPHVVFSKDITYTSIAEKNQLLLNIEKGQYTPTLILKTNYRQTPQSQVLLELKMGEVIGRQSGAINHFQLAWTNTVQFTEHRSIIFQIMPDSTAYVFMGRRDAALLQSPALQLSILGAGQSAVMYEIKEMNILEVDKHFSKAFFPPGLNYEKINPL